MGAGERRTNRQHTAEREEAVTSVPLLRSARRRTVRALAAHVERLRVPAGTTIAEQGRPAHWVAFGLDGALTSTAPVGRHRSWSVHEPVHLAEALVHGVAPETVVAAVDSDVLLVPVRALTAALSTDGPLGLAVARALASTTRATRPDLERTTARRRFERRRVLAAPPIVRPAA